MRIWEEDVWEDIGSDGCGWLKGFVIDWHVLRVSCFVCESGREREISQFFGLMPILIQLWPLCNDDLANASSKLFLQSFTSEGDDTRFDEISRNFSRFCQSSKLSWRLMTHLKMNQLPSKLRFDFWQTESFPLPSPAMFLNRIFKRNESVESTHSRGRQ